MSEDFYRNITESVRRIRHGVRLLCIMDRLITFACAGSYGLLLIYEFFNAPWLLPETVVVPAAGFVLLTVIRAAINSPRPYEVFGTEPVIPKETVGHGFPSRHVFSIFVIGCTYYRLDHATGAVFFLLGAILAALRVAGGVHFIKDVTVAAVAGVIYSLIGYAIAAHFAIGGM